MNMYIYIHTTDWQGQPTWISVMSAVSGVQSVLDARGQ